MAKRGRPPIQDRFTDLSMSRQWKWQLRKLRSDGCIICPKPGETGTRCKKHAALAREGSERRYYSRSEC